jgi:hypothetical protein
MQTVAIIVALIVSYGAMVWIGMVFWTFNDIRARSQNIVTQILATILVLVSGPLGLFLFYILRPQQTLVEAYEHSLEEETLLQEIENRHLCPTCNERIQDDFQVCPSCLTKLRRQCHFCSRLLAPEWSLCPYCGR